jgi:adhesin/invasin
MALDAEGSAYLVVGGSTKYLIRVTPGANNTAWLWDKVATINYNGASGGGGTDFWGMAFVNGILYLSSGDDIWWIDTMSGVMTFGLDSPGNTIYDLAACQAAPVIRGTVFNDENGNGQQDADEAGVPGQTVSIFDSTGTYKGYRTTDGSGGYSFIVNRVGPTAKFYVRLKHPRVGGVNAAQTYASADSTPNPVVPLCATDTDDYVPMTESGVCLGARRDHVDTNATPSGSPTSANGVTGATGGAGIVTEVTMLVDTEVAVADFGVTSAGSHGDAPWKTVLSSGVDNGPSHVAAGVYGNDLWLGVSHGVNDPVAGPSTAGVVTDPHGVTDDGVQVRMSDSSPWVPLSEVVLAINKSYGVRVQVSGVLAAGARVQGWGGALVNAVSPTASTIFGSAIVMDNGGAVSGDGFAYGQINTGTGNPSGAPPTWARFRVSLVGGLSATDVPPYPPTQSNVNANTVPWWVPGEVEDYRLYVASGTLALQARSVGGQATFGFTTTNISGTSPSSTTDSIATAPNNEWAPGTSGHAFQSVGQPVSFTASGVPAGYNVVGAQCSAADGSDIVVARSGSTFTIPASQVVTGAAITCGVSFAREISTQESSLTVTPAGPLLVTEANGYTASVVVKAADGTALEGVHVRFGVSPTDGVTVTPPLLDGENCVTDATGTCSVNIKSTSIGTYTITADAQNLGSTTWVPIGSVSRDYVIDPEICSLDLATSPAGSLVVGNTFVGTITLSDQYGNPCSGLVGQLSRRSDPSTGVTLGPIGAVAGEPGKYSFTIGSTAYGPKDITASYARVGAPASEDTERVNFVSDVGSATALLEVTPSSLRVHEDATATVTITDSSGNPVEGTVEFTFETLPTAQNPAPITTVNGGVAQQVFTTDTIKNVRVTARVTLTESGQVIATTPVERYVNFTHGPVSVLTSTLEAGVSTDVPADGVSEHTAIATVRDEYGNPVRQAPVTFTHTGVGTITNSGATPGEWRCETNDDGVCTLVLVSQNVTGPAVVSAKFGEPGGTASTSVQVSATDPTPKVLSLNFVFTDITGGSFEVRTPVSPAIVANGTAEHVIWVRVWDGARTPVTGAGAQIQMTVRGVEDLGLADGVTVTETATPGLYEVRVRSLNAGVFPAGGKVVGFDLERVGSADTITFVAGRATNATLDVPVHTAVVANDVDTHLVRVVVRDDHGNGVPGASFSARAVIPGTDPPVLATWATPLTAVDGSVVPFAGVYEGYIRTGVAGSYTVTATVTSESPGVVATSVAPSYNNIALFRNGEVCEGTTTLGVVPGRLEVGGTAVATVYARDCQGNPVDGQDVQFGTNPGIALAANGQARTADGTGQAQVDVSTLVENTYGVYVDVLAGDGSVLFTVGPENVEFYAEPARGVIEIVSVTPTVPPLQLVGVGSYTVTARVTDSVGHNPITVGTVRAATVPAGDSTVTLGAVTPVGTSRPGEYTFTVRSTSLDVKTVRATYEYQARTDSDDATVQFRNDDISGSLTTLTFDPASRTTVVDRPMKAIVTVRDLNDQPIPGATVNLTIADSVTGQPLRLADGTVFTGTTGTTPTNGVWEYTFSTRNAATYTVRAEVGAPGGNTVTKEDDVVFTNDVCSATNAKLISSTAGGSKKPGQEFHEATVQLYDQYDNPCLGYDNIPVAFEVTSSVGAIDTSFSPVTGNADRETGRRTVRIVSPDFREGTAVVRARTSGTLVPSESNPGLPAELSLNFANDGGPHADSYFTVTTGTRTANGTDSHRVTVVLEVATDTGTIPMSGQASLLKGWARGAAGEGDGVVTVFTETSTPGTYVADITSTSFGYKTVSVTWNEGTLNETSIVPQGTDRVFFDGDIAHPVITLSADTSVAKIADGVQAYTVTARVSDTTGRPIVRGTVTPAPQTGTTGLTIGSATPVDETTQPGVWTFTVASNEIGSKTVVGTYAPPTGQGVSDTVTLPFTFDDPNADHSTLVVAPGRVAVDTNVTATVMVRDRFDHPIADADVRIEVKDEDGGLIVPVTPVTWTGQTSAQGGYAVTFTTRTAGTYTVTATATSRGVTITPTGSPATVIFDPGPVSAARTTLTSATALDVRAPDGVAQHYGTVTVRDQWDNPVPGQPVEFFVTGGTFGITTRTTPTGGTGTGTTGTSGVDGTYNIAITSLAVATAHVTASAAGQQVQSSPGQQATLDLVFDMGGPCTGAQYTYYTITPAGPLTVATTPYTIRAHLETCAGEPVVTKAPNLTARATAQNTGEGDASVTAFTEDPQVRGEYTATITSTRSGIKDVVVEWRDNPQAVPFTQLVAPKGPENRTTVEFTAEDNPDTLYYSVSDFLNVPADGLSRQYVYVYAADRYGNPIMNAAPKLSARNPDGRVTVGGFASDDAAPGRYIAPVTSGNAGSHLIEATFTQSGTGQNILRQNAQTNVNAVFVADIAQCAAVAVTGTSPQTVGIGQYTVRVTVTDGVYDAVTQTCGGNPVQGENVLLSARNAAQTHSATVIPASGVVTTGASGVAEYTVRSDRADVFHLVATYGVSTQANNAPDVEFAAGAPSATESRIYLTSDYARRSDGEASYDVNIELLDSFRNPVRNTAVRFELAAGTPVFAETIVPPAVLAPGVNAQVNTDGYGKATIYVRSATPVAATPIYGSFQTGATWTRILDQVTGTAQHVDLTFEPGGVNPDNSSVEVATRSETRTANGTATHTVRVRLVDDDGNPAQVNTTRIDGQARLGALTIPLVGWVKEQVDNPNDANYIARFSTETVGVYTVTASYAGSAIRILQDQGGLTNYAQFVPGDPVLARTTFTVSQELGKVANGSDKQIVTVKVADAQGNPTSVLGGPVLDLSASGSPTVISNFVSTGTVGEYTAEITSLVAGSFDIQAYLRVSGTPQPIPLASGGNRVAQFVPGGAHASASSLVVDRASQVVGGPVVATVTVLDAYGPALGQGNPVEGQMVRVVIDPQTDPATPQSVLTGLSGADGTVTFTFTSRNIRVNATHGVRAYLVRPGGTLDEVSLSPRQVTFTVGSAAAAVLERVSEAVAFVGTATSPHEVKVTVTDQYGNPKGGEQVTFVPNGLPAQATYTPSSRQVTTGGDGTATMYVRSTVVGSGTVSASIPGLNATPGSVSLEFANSTVDPSKSSWWLTTTGTKTADGTEADGSAHKLTVHLRDTNNVDINDVTLARSIRVDAIGPRGASYAAVKGVANFTATGTSGEFTVNLVTTAAEVKNIEVDLGGVIPPAATTRTTAEWVAGDPVRDRSSFSVSTTPVVANGVDWVPVTVILRDAQDNPVKDADGWLTAVAQPATSGVFGSGAADGEYVARLYSERVGDFTTEVNVLHGAVSFGIPYGSNNDVAHFVPGDPSTRSELSLVTAGQTKAITTEFHVAKVIAKDSTGNVVPGATVVFSAAAGAREVNGLALPVTVTANQQGEAFLNFTADAVGSYAVTARVSRGASAPQDATGSAVGVFVNPNVSGANSYFEVGQEMNVIADDDPAHYQLITVYLESAEHVAIAGRASDLTASWSPQTGPRLLDLDAAAPGNQFFVPSTRGAGYYEARMVSTKANNFTVGVSIDSTPLNPPTADRAIARFIPGVGDPTKSVLRVSAANVQVGQSITAYVDVLDVNDNKPVGQWVEFKTDPLDPIQHTVSTAEVLADQTDENGVAEVRLSTRRPGTYTVYADLAWTGDNRAPVSNSGTIEITFVVGPPSPATTTLTGSTGDKQSDDTAFHNAVVTVLDEYDNPIAGRAVTFTPESPPGQSGAVIGRRISTVPEDGVTGPDGKVEVRYVGDHALGTTLMGASVGPMAVTNGQTDPARLTWNWVTGTVDGDSYYELSEGTRQADGVQSHTVTVRLTDSQGRAVVGEAGNVSLEARVAPDQPTQPQGTSYTLPSHPVEGPPGVYTATMTSTYAATFDITVTHATAGTIQPDPGVSPPRTTLRFVAGAPDPRYTSFSVTTAPPDRVANGLDFHTLTATIRDGNQNGVPGLTVRAQDTELPEHVVSVDTFTTTAITAGVYTAALRSSTSGSFPMTATWATSPTATETSLSATGNRVAVFEPGGVDPGMSTLSVTPRPATGDVGVVVGRGTWELRVEARDAQGNPVGGESVRLRVPGVEPALSQVVPVDEVTLTTGDSGVAIYTLNSTKAGPFTVSAYVNGIDEVTGSPQQVVFVPGGSDPERTELVGSTGSRLADGQAAHTATVRVRDQYGNLVTGQRVAFQVDQVGTVRSTIPPDGLSDANGEVVISIVSDAMIGESVVTAKLGDQQTGSPVLASPGVPKVLRLSFVPGTISDANSYYLVSEGERTVGTGTHLVTVALRDAAGAPVPLDPGRWNVDIVGTAGPDATIGAWREDDEASTQAVYVADISSTVAGLKTVGVSVLGVNMYTNAGGPPNSLTVRFVPGEATTVDYSVSQTPGVRANGTDPQILTVTVRDAYGNDRPDMGAQIVPSTVDSVVETPPRWVSTATDPAVREQGHYEARITSVHAGSHLTTVNFGNQPVTTSNNRYAVFAPDTADPGQSQLSVSPGVVRVGDDTHWAEVLVRDQNQNPVSGQAVTFWTVPVTTPTRLMYTDQSGTDGKVRVNFTTQTPGVYTVYAALGINDQGQQVVGSGTLTVEFRHTDIDWSNTKLAGTTEEKLVNSATDPHKAWVTVEDRFHNPVISTGTTVTFNVANLPGATFGPLGQPAQTSLTVPVATADDPLTGAVAGRALVELSSGALGTARVTANVGAVAVTDPSYVDMTFVNSDIDPAKSSWSVTDQTRQADGIDYHVLTVRLRDVNDAGVPGRGNLISVTLPPVSGATGRPATLARFAEVPGSPGDYTARITSTYAEVYDVGISVGGPIAAVAGSPTSVEFVPGDPEPGLSEYSVTTGTRIANGNTTGVDFHTVTVILRDAQGNGVPDRQGSLSAPTNPFSVAAFTQVDRVTQPGVYTARITSTRAVDRTVFPTYAGSQIPANGNQVARFVPGPADPGKSTITLLTTGSKLVVAEFHQVQVTALDANDNPLVDVPVTFATAPQIVDPAWNDEIRTDGNGEAVLTITSRAPGSYNASATILNRDGTTTVPTPDGSTIMVFRTGPVEPAMSYYTVTQNAEVRANGTDFQTLTVFLADASRVGISGLGDPGSVIYPHLDLTGPTFGPFEEDPATPGLYTSKVRSERIGRFTVTVSVNQNGEKIIPVLTPNGNDTTLFIPGAADPEESSLSARPLSQVVDRDVTAEVEVLDGFQNPVAGQSVRFWVVNSHGQRIELRAGAEELEPRANAAGIASITFTTSIAGVYTVHAALIGVPGGDVEVTGSGAVDVEFTAGRTPDLTLSRLTGTDGTSKLVGGDPVTGVHTATVSVVDTSAAHNPIPDLPIEFTIDPAGVGTVRAPTTLITRTDAAGIAVLEIVSNDAGDALVSAKATDQAAIPPVQVPITAETATGIEAPGLTMPFHPDTWVPGHSSFQVSTGNKWANGTDPHTITVLVQDRYDNGVPGAANDIHPTSSPAAGVTIGAFTALNPASYPFDGLYTAPITSTVAGIKVVAVNLGTTAIAVLPAGLDTATFQATDPNPAASWFEVDTTPATAGEDSVPVRVTLRDDTGNGVTGQAGTLNARATADGVPDATVSGFRATGVDGVYVADIRADQATDFTVTVTYTKPGNPAVGLGHVEPGPPPVVRNDIASFEAGDEDPTRSILTVTQGTVVVGGTHTATVTVRDGHDNPKGGVAVTFWTTPDITAGGTGSISPATIITSANGSGIAQVTLRTTVAGRYTVHATFVDPATGEPAGVRYSGQVSVVFEAGPPSSTQSFLDIPTEGVDPVEIANGDDRHTVTVTILDADRNPKVGERATVKIVPPGGTLGEATEYSSDASDVNGVATVRFGATIAGTYTAYGYITVSGAPAEVADSPKHATFVPGPADPLMSVIEVQAPRTVEANGTDRTTAIVTLKDRDGNVTGVGGAGHTVTVIPSIGTANTATDNGDGTYTVTLTSLVAGLSTVGFEMDGVGSPSHDTVTFVATPTAPVIRYANAGTMVGTAQTGNTIRVYGPNDVLTCTTLVTASGTFRCSPLVPEAQHETVLSATSSVSVGGRTFTSSPASVVVDAVPPGRPTVDPSDGGTVSGQDAEPGTSVVITDEDGTELCRTIAAPDGTFVCEPLRPRPGDGDVIEVVVIDDSDNRSDPWIEVIDDSAPDAPRVEDSDGSIIYGQAEEGSHVVISDGNGEVLCEADTDPGSGAFSCVPVRPVDDGEEIVVNATDPAGNTSTDTIVVVDQSGVAAPFIDPSNGETVNGKGVPGLEIIVRFPTGDTVTTTVRSDGTWQVKAPDGYNPKDGDAISATQSREFNQGGPKVSPSTTIRVDRTPPEAPTFNPSDGTTISGKGEPGATVIITDTDGRELGRTVVEGNGEWTARLEPAAAEGSTVTATQVDPAGNIGPAAKLRIGKIRLVVDVPLLRNLETQTVHVYNLQPGEKVTATMFSDPVDLGGMVADSSGSAVYTFAVPITVGEGAHHVEATGTFSGKGTSAYFNVVPPQAPVIPATATVTPTVTISATPTITQPVVAVQPTPLAKTGAEGMIPAVGSALGALLAGLFLIIAAARRRRDIDNGQTTTTYGGPRR